MSQVKTYDSEHATPRFRTLGPISLFCPFVLWKEWRIGRNQKRLGAGSREGVSQVKAYDLEHATCQLRILGPISLFCPFVLWKEKRNRMKSERTGRRVLGGRVSQVKAYNLEYAIPRVRTLGPIALFCLLMLWKSHEIRKDWAQGLGRACPRSRLMIWSTQLSDFEP